MQPSHHPAPARRPFAGGAAARTMLKPLVFAGCITASLAVAAQDLPAADDAPFKELGSGIASWYGPGLLGRRTASGEPLDGNELTAAHRTLPFGTLVRVRNPRNGREVVVRINDRGPRLKDRIIDLSKAAAAQLGLLKVGKAPVVLIEH